MVAESRPLQLLIRRMRTPPRLYQRNHDTHKQNYASFVVYIYAKPKWGMSNELWPYEPSYTPYGCGESTSTPPLCLMRTPLRLYPRNHGTHKQNYASFVVYICVPRIIRRLYMCAKPKWGMSNELWRCEPSYIPYGGGDSTSTSPKSPHEDTSSTIPTQP